MRGLLQGAAVVQTAYVVDNLDRACERAAALYGVGPFLVMRNLPLPDATYRGRAERLELSVALAQWGDLQLELIQQESAGPSAVRDMFAPGTGGLHHVAVFCDDYRATTGALAAAGYPVATEFHPLPGATIGIVDTRPALGHMVELVPPIGPIQDLYAAVRSAAEQWDGSTELLRPLQLTL